MDKVLETQKEDYALRASLKRQTEAAAGGQQVGVCVLLKRDEGQLPDADCGCAEGEHQNRGNISYEQRDTIHIIPAA